MFGLVQERLLCRKLKVSLAHDIYVKMHSVVYTVDEYEDDYCWWTKSCTTKDDEYPIIYRVLTIPGGAGVCPSTAMQLCHICKYVTPLEQCRCIRGMMSATQLRWFAALLWPPWKMQKTSVHVKPQPGKSDRITSITNKNNMKCWEPIDFIILTHWLHISKAPQTSKLLGKNEKVRRLATLSIPRRWARVPVGNNGCGFLEVRLVVSCGPARGESPTTLWLIHIWFLQGHHLTWWFLMFHVVYSVFHFIDMCFTKWN